MNSYSLGLSGSWLILAALGIIALSAAIYYYFRTNPPISSGKKRLLTLLRTLGLWSLLLLLFEPILSHTLSFTQEPMLSVAVDNSVSMNLPEGETPRKEIVKRLLGDDGIFSEFTSIVSTFGEKVFLTDKNTDSLQFNEERTNISRALRWNAERFEDQNIRAVVLMTDGNYNEGDNPLLYAEQLGRPVFVIGLGDTTEPKDIAVTSLVVNDLSYIQTPTPVRATFTASGCDDCVLEAILREEGKEIAKQPLNFSKENRNTAISFEYTPQKEGIRKLSVEIRNVNASSKTTEITTKNNSMSAFTDVLKTKRKYLIFAGAPSPDVAFVRRILEEDNASEVESFIQKQGAEFYDSSPSQSVLSSAECIVFIGFPTQSTPSPLLAQLDKAMESGTPLLFVAGNTTDYGKLKSIDRHLPFSVLHSRPQEFLVSLEVQSSALANSIFSVGGAEMQSKEWNQLPPIFRSETFVRVKPESEVLATQSINAVASSEPLILARSFQQEKSFAILGYGLYRWKLLGQAADIARGKNDVPDYLREFISNSAKWLSADNTKKLVNIRAIKRYFSSGERIEFSGQVYDVALNPVDNAEVSAAFSVMGKDRTVYLRSLGGGRYTGSSAPAPKGDYSYVGTAVIGGVEYGNDRGAFSVGETSVEFQNPRMNIALLREMANRTGGKFYTSKQCTTLEEDIKKHPMFMPASMKKNNELALWNLPWTLASAIVFFALEWIIRSRLRLL